MTKLKSISIDLNDRNSDNIILEKLSELKIEGNSYVDLNVKNSSPEKLEKLKLNVDLFRKIKEIQDLPDWVIIKLFLAERQLNHTDFKGRIPNG
jgi:hypothetical protein